MVRRLLLPLLGLALFATEATAQTHPAAKAKASTKKVVRHTARPTHPKKVAKVAPRVVKVPVAAAPALSGWSNERTPETPADPNTLYQPHTNVSVAPGMPLNQLGGGLTCDYNGRPLRRPAPRPGVTLAAAQ